ncbi:GNAT family N-acetyltransferase [Nocardia sp. NPDC059764]|uniref:GNAT family N-acetyltransferase n=1 Tax=Nocardia sp. NPDC059764 TaxID=3346939 RepID=UPI0036527F48
MSRLTSRQRTGANREAKILLLDYAFTDWQVHRVRFRTDVRNTRSRRAIESLGATLDGILRADFSDPDATVRDSAYYSILATEWPTIRSSLVTE